MRRANLAKAIYDLGKLSFGALVLGPVVADGPFHAWVFAAGIACTTATFAAAWLLDKGES